MAGQPPSDTVTFLLTDLEGSTRLWEQDPEAMKAAMVRHDELLENAISARPTASYSRGWAMVWQSRSRRPPTPRRRLLGSNVLLPTSRGARRDRCGPGSGSTPTRAIVVNNNYASQPVNRCSRLMAAAHGGQVVISGATEALVRDEFPDGLGLVDLGEHRFGTSVDPCAFSSCVSEGAPRGLPTAADSRLLPGKPSRSGEFVYWSPSRRGSRRLGVRRVPGGDHHRSRRSGQDPLGNSGRRRLVAPLPGGCLARRSWPLCAIRRAWSTLWPRHFI